MKQYNLDIITADKTVTFSVQEPETNEEMAKGLSYIDTLPDKHGMIYFKINPEKCFGGRCLNARMNTRDTKFPVDFLFIDWCGNIKKIDKNVPALSSEIHTDINVICVLEINAGDCDKYGIEVGDSVIHEKLEILPGNKIKFHSVMFDKITQRTLNKIDKEDIAFFAIAEGGAMGWAGAMQIITEGETGPGLFFIDSTGISDFKKIKELFPPVTKLKWGFIKDSIDNPDWDVLNMGFGNHLFIKKKFSKSFFEQIKDVHPYQNWIKVALNLLKG